MRVVLLLVLGCWAAIFSFSGCTSPTMLGEDFGVSLDTAKRNQRVHAEPAKPLEPVTGLEGQAAARLIQRHINSFEHPAASSPASVPFGAPTPSPTGTGMGR